jgi:hypothetical protein
MNLKEDPDQAPASRRLETRWGPPSTSGHWATPSHQTFPPLPTWHLASPFPCRRLGVLLTHDNVHFS